MQDRQEGRREAQLSQEGRCQGQFLIVVNNAQNESPCPHLLTSTPLSPHPSLPTGRDLQDLHLQGPQTGAP